MTTGGMKVVKVVFLLFVMALPTTQTPAQTEPEYTMELGIGAGMMSYEGDYNGNVFKCMKPSAALLYRYLFNPRSAIRASLDYGTLKGSSESVKTVYPEPADNWSFSNMLIDINAIYEYNFWPYGTGKDYRGAQRLTPYVLVGVGMTYVKTGGSTVTANVPFGLGIKYKMGKRVNLNLEWVMHFSLSDKFDGMKDPYNIASSGPFKNADCYSQLMINLTYSFKERCRVCHNDRE